MVRPHHFTPNPATAADNAFQVDVAAEVDGGFAASAHREVTDAAAALTDAGVRVHLFDDESTSNPDSVFPNNWFSTHSGGHVAIYPMHSPSRRGERRWDIIEMLKAEYRVQDVIDYSGLENDDVFLEGTGAMVLDHATRIAYTARSNRADPIALERFCTNFGYEPMVFDAADSNGVQIYHTNVLMCVATDFALVGLELLTNEVRRTQVVDRLAASDRTVIELSEQQVRDFAGNAIELRGTAGRVLAMSTRARDALTPDQRTIIERSARIVAVDVPTIELAGGSVRCMLAGIHLDRR